MSTEPTFSLSPKPGPELDGSQSRICDLVQRPRREAIEDRRATHTEYAICLIVSKSIAHDAATCGRFVRIDRVAIRDQHSRVGTRLDGEQARRSHCQHARPHNPKSHQAHRSDWNHPAASYLHSHRGSLVWVGEAHSSEPSKFQE